MTGSHHHEYSNRVDVIVKWHIRNNMADKHKYTGLNQNKLYHIYLLNKRKLCWDTLII